MGKGIKLVFCCMVVYWYIMNFNKILRLFEKK
jgi:hypothetical protein